MPALPLAGPSYQLRNRRADVQRCVNWVPVQIESGSGKGGAQSYLKQVPGKRMLATLGGAAAGGVRGLRAVRGVLYAVSGDTLYRVTADGAAAALGAVGGADPVSMAENNTQLCVAAGSAGYVYDLDTEVLSRLVGNWRGSTLADVLDGYGVFAAPGTNQLYTSGAQDFTTINALDFASAEGSSGVVVAHLVKHREVLVLKERTGEVWYDAGNADGIPLSVNTGAAVEVGCIAPHSLRKMAGLAFWLGQDDRGAAVVFSMSAYVPQRISTHAIEELLGSLTLDQLAAARAYCYHQEGLSYYVLQVPGLPTTWVYELASGVWHERAEWVAGSWAPDLGLCHAFAYGMHIVGTADGRLCVLDPSLSTSAGGPLVRERITPHMAQPGANVRRFGSLQIDCSVGAGLAGADGLLMLRYSNDGGMTWGNERQMSLGRIGEYRTRCRATRLGSARDRVWSIRVSDDVRCEPIAALVDEV